VTASGTMFEAAVWEINVHDKILIKKILKK